MRPGAGSWPENAAASGRRVVFVNRFCWPDHSATAQLLSDLAFGLAARGWKVCVMTSRLRYDDPRARLPAREWVNGVTVLRLATPGFGRGTALGRLIDYLGFHRAVAVGLSRLLRPGDLVVAMTDPPMLAVTVARIAARRRARLVNWVQDWFPEVGVALRVPGLAGPVARLLVRLRRLALGSAALNITISPALAARFGDDGVAPGRVLVIPNWVDARAIRPIPAAASRLRRARLPRARLVVGYSGNLGPAHEAGTLLTLLRALRHRQEIAFLFIGGGSGMAWLRRRAAAEGLVQACFLPYQPRAALTDSLGAADLHLVTLHPALEGLGLPSKLYGVLAAGRPVLFLGDPAGEVARLVRAAGVGLVVPSGAAGELAAALLALAGDRLRCAAMGRRARALAEDRFALDAQLLRWEQALRGLGSGTP